MANKQIVVIFGVTGVQGGSVVRALLEDDRTFEKFALRGITRDPNSAKSKALTERGVECVKGDLSSEEDLKKALKDAYAVYAVTNYWDSRNPETELQQGRNIANAAKESGVQHLIWSSLLDVTELTQGKFSHVDHFVSKANVEKYIRSLGIPATFFMPGFYMQNIAGGMMRAIGTDKDTKNDDGDGKQWVFTLPVPERTQIPLFDAAADAGKFVKAILLHRDETLGKRVYGATDYYSCADIVSQFSEVKSAAPAARFNQISADEYKQMVAAAMKLDERGQLELLENMQFMTDYGYYGKASLEESHKILSDQLTTWKQFVAKAPQFN